MSQLLKHVIGGSYQEAEHLLLSANDEERERLLVERARLVHLRQRLEVHALVTERTRPLDAQLEHTLAVATAAPTPGEPAESGDSSLPAEYDSGASGGGRK